MLRKRSYFRPITSVVGACVVFCGVAGATASAETSRAFENLCTPTDPGLEELSGMAVIGTSIYGIGDSGSDDRVAELDSNCQVRRWIPVGTPRIDVEDMASTEDGRLWLADIGDNTAVRTNIALIGLDPQTGATSTHSLTYPDRAHDAEALLLQKDGLPIVVTKDYMGNSGIYTPRNRETVYELGTGAPTPLAKVGTLTMTPTRTTGGPIPYAGTMAITGGAVSKDGKVVALRTYTDVYIYFAPDGDVVKALKTTPVRVPAPDEPQGEAIAFTDEGDLLSGSEQLRGPLPPVRVLRDATGTVQIRTPITAFGALGP
ncbi:hypothetical protein ABH922_001594 [Rhodococcus sp. 27YEA15]|uniref:hypothetical protein n=1 Tax=Rhodococcus sp. 27YEA15 TaxID=3156259 RepID=UPI003C7C830B